MIVGSLVVFSQDVGPGGAATPASAGAGALDVQLPQGGDYPWGDGLSIGYPVVNGRSKKRSELGVLIFHISPTHMSYI